MREPFSPATTSRPFVFTLQSTQPLLQLDVLDREEEGLLREGRLDAEPRADGALARALDALGHAHGAVARHEGGLDGARLSRRRLPRSREKPESTEPATWTVPGEVDVARRGADVALRPRASRGWRRGRPSRRGPRRRARRRRPRRRGSSRPPPSPRGSSASCSGTASAPLGPRRLDGRPSTSMPSSPGVARLGQLEDRIARLDAGHRVALLEVGPVPLVDGVEGARGLVHEPGRLDAAARRGRLCRGRRPA